MTEPSVETKGYTWPLTWWNAQASMSGGHRHLSCWGRYSLSHKPTPAGLLQHLRRPRQWQSGVVTGLAHTRLILTCGRSRFSLPIQRLPTHPQPSSGLYFLNDDPAFLLSQLPCLNNLLYFFPPLGGKVFPGICFKFVFLLISVYASFSYHLNWIENSMLGQWAFFLSFLE